MIINCTKTTPLSLVELFQTIEAKTLHLYALGNVVGEDSTIFLPNSIYPFKGVQIDTIFYTQLRSILKIKSEYTDFYATYQQQILKDKTLLLIRVHHLNEFNATTSLYGLIYNTITKKLETSQLLAHDYDTEGRFGKLESWITDWNGEKIIISRSQQTEFNNEPPFIVHQDSIKVSYWKKREFLSIKITDTTIKKNLIRQFPYYHHPFIDKRTEQQLTKYLEQE